MELVLYAVLTVVCLEISQRMIRKATIRDKTSRETSRSQNDQPHSLPPYNVAHAGMFSHFPFNIEEGGGSFEFYMKN